ncbi:MAG: TIM barrel protein [Allobranchiibius sp.]
MATTRYAVNISILFTEIPFLERPAAASAAGFDAIECWWPWSTATPGQDEQDAFVSAVKDAGVQLIGLNFFAGDMPGGDRGLVSWVDRQDEFAENIPVVVDLGRRLDCHAFNALYGNRVEGIDDVESDHAAVLALAAAGRAVAEIDGIVLVEPVSGSPAYPLKTADDVFAVIDRVKDETGVENLEFLCDLFHLSVNGDDLDSVVERYGSRSGHVQIADAPGRGEPGTGELDLSTYIERLQTAGYDGYIALEYKTTSTTEAGLDQWLPRNERGSNTDSNNSDNKEASSE